MYIEWYGQSCFKIQSKPNGQETVVITDPFTNSCGLRAPRFNADIITVCQINSELFSTDNIKNSVTDKNPFPIIRPGEYEVNDISIYGVAGSSEHSAGKEKNKNTLFIFTVENVKIAHLSYFNQKTLTAKQLEKINGIDVLLIPIGGENVIDSPQARNLISDIEPRIVIPMLYKIPGLKTNFNGLDKFIKEMGQPQEETDRLKIIKKDLPQEETKFIVLKPR